MSSPGEGVPGRGEPPPSPPSRDADGRYSLWLYVTGMTPRSTAAIRRVRAICDELLAERYDLKVIDIYQQPGMAKDAQIVATPTLVKRLPLPLRRLVGDFSNRQRVLNGLNLYDIPEQEV